MFLSQSADEQLKTMKPLQLLQYLLLHYEVISYIFINISETIVQVKNAVYYMPVKFISETPPKQKSDKKLIKMRFLGNINDKCMARKNDLFI